MRQIIQSTSQVRNFGYAAVVKGFITIRRKFGNCQLSYSKWSRSKSFWQQQGRNLFTRCMQMSAFWNCWVSNKLWIAGFKLNYKWLENTSTFDILKNSWSWMLKWVQLYCSSQNISKWTLTFRYFLNICMKKEQTLRQKISSIVLLFTKHFYLYFGRIHEMDIINENKEVYSLFQSFNQNI